MKIIEINEDKMQDLCELAEKMLKHGGKMMQCLEELKDKGESGQRSGGRSGNRGGYSERWGDDDTYPGDDGYEGYGHRSGERMGDMSERRGVRGTGYYSRYR